MALFGSKKNTGTAPEAQRLAPHEVFGAILRPHVTEKSAIVSDRGVYVFEVARDATKGDVAQAVSAIYKVTPVRVNIVRRAPRVESGRTRRFVSRQKGMKKAYVYLKEGEKIEFA
jgi:large subunit ribosomal protein L23